MVCKTALSAWLDHGTGNIAIGSVFTSFVVLSISRPLFSQLKMDAISISHQNKAIKKINALLIDQKSWGALNLILIN